MNNALYVGLSRQMTLKRQMDVIANNIANSDTVGFKVESLMLREDVQQAAPKPGLQPAEKITFVHDAGVSIDYTQGALKQTGGTYDLGSGPRVFPQVQEANYPLSNCISCTCCMEVCPQFNDVTGFVGAATIAQVKLFNNHPTGKVLKEERLRALAGDGGVQECGYAQNCVEVCPKQIPLTTAISDVSRDVFVQKAKDLLRG